MAIAAAMQETKILRQLSKDMSGSYKDDGVITLYFDNQSAIAITKNSVQHQRSKHIDIKYHFVRAEVQNGKAQLEYVPSEYNAADVFTKPSK